MRHTFIRGLPRSTIFFSHYLINGTIFENKLIEHKIHVSLFSTNFSQKFLILGRTENIGPDVKYPLLLLTILTKLELFRQIFETCTNITFYQKYVQWGPDFSVRTDGRVDRSDEASRCFCSFANAHNKRLKYTFLRTASV